MPIGRTIKEFFNKNQDLTDIRNGVVGAIAINVEEPVFESQTKVKLGSKDMSPTGGVSVNKFVNDFVKPATGQLPAQESADRGDHAAENPG